MVQLREQLPENINCFIYCCDMRVRTVAVICSAPKEQGGLKAEFELLSQAFEESNKQKLSFAIGSEVDNILDLYLSYSEALTLIKYSAPHQDKNDKKQSGGADIERYPYTVSVQAKIFQLIKNSDTQQTVSYIRDFYENRLKPIENSVWMFTQYVYDLLFVLFQAYEEIRTSPDFDHISFLNAVNSVYSCESFTVQYDTVLNLYSMVCDHLTNARTNKNNPLLDNIQKYIVDNFSSYNLSLEQTADQFNLSKAYLSSLFKDKTGENFSAYVERLRVDKSCILMNEGRHNINTISEMVGYSSAQVFRRAFKRMKGISPSEYIINKKKEEI